ncbi:transmembrane protein [Ceratobasidium sp. AG-Ba]|nr:transmembrane protein [Ceratobasidium sp. AG-Ba]QRW11051.1 transmembrane protein [Ceratobasidium sp. AG-Ba]
MILDTETSTKSPTSQPQSPASPARYLYSQASPVSYSTFAVNNPPRTGPDANFASDITALLGREDQFASDDQPPAYDEINATKPKGNRLRARFVGVLLACLLVYSTWSSYRYTKGFKSTPNSPTEDPSHHSTSTTSTSTALSTSTSIQTLPPAAPTNSPSSPPILPLPPSGDIPSPSDPPFVLPDEGRTDMCRIWAYSLDSGAYPVSSGRLPTEKIVYNIPSLAPIQLETRAICRTGNGFNAPCSEYDDSTDAVSGKLQVLAGDVEFPRIEMFVQHSSELGLDDLSICLTKRLSADGAQGHGNEPYKWSIRISVFKDPFSSRRNNLLASLAIILTLPAGYAHDLTTELDFFTQRIGYAQGPQPPRLLFGNLRLGGEYGRIDVWNANAASIVGHSSYSPLSVSGSRIGGSLVLKSKYAVVECNVTLVQTEDGPPVQVDMQSAEGGVVIVVDLDYPLYSHKPSQFDIQAQSKFTRSLMYISDHRGTDALKNHRPPNFLPVLRMNVTSEAAIAQAILPATYMGTFDLQSTHAQIGLIDQAKHVPGRALGWDSRELNAIQGTVSWGGARQAQGNLHIATAYAAARLLFIGMDDHTLEDWPKESSEWRLERVA